MTQSNFSLTPTPEELRNILMGRIERGLADNGVVLTAQERSRIVEVLLSRSDATGETPRPVATQRHTEPVASNGEPRSRRDGRPDHRARAYKPTKQAKPVNHPTSTADRVINLILNAKPVCTLDDLKKGTGKPAKAIYNALWQLRNAGLVETVPLAVAQKS